MNKILLLFFSSLFIFGLSWSVSLNFALIALGPMMILAILYMQNPFPQRADNIYIMLAFLSVFIFLILINITLYEHINYYYITELIKKVIFTFSLFSFTILFYSNRTNLLVKSIDTMLIVVVFLWYLQLIGYYVTGDYLDLLEPFGRIQRYKAYWIQSSLPFDIIRPTSIYIEPGTYAVNTLPLLILSYLSHQKITKLHIFLLISYFGSFSLFAIIIGSAFLFIVELSKFEFKLTKKNIFLLIMFSLIAVGVEQYLHFRFVAQQNMGAVGLRENIIDYWLSLDGMNILLGQGNAQMLFTRATVEDASFMFKLIFEYGIFSIPYFLVMFYVSRGLPIFFLLIILITKLHYELYIVWFYFAALHIIMQEKRELYYD